MYTANTAAVPAVDYIHVFELHDVYQFWQCCVQPTRAVAGERRWASDGGRAICMYTAIQQYLQQYLHFLRYVRYISAGQHQYEIPFCYLRLVRIFSGSERATAGKRRHTSKKVMRVKQGKRKTPEGMLVLDIRISNSGSNRKMASVFNQVKMYLGQSLVSELSLMGCVKTPEPNDEIRFPHRDRSYHTYRSCRTGVRKKGGVYPPLTISLCVSHANPVCSST